MVDLSLTADRWSLDDLFQPIVSHLLRNPFPDAKSILPSAKLLSLEKSPNKLRIHIRTQTANYLSSSLQASFPNPPTADCGAVLQSFHDVNELVPTLTLAAKKAPFLPLLHGMITAIESRLDDSKLSSYMQALPIASAGVPRLLSCDAATARWPARAVRIAATIASGAANDVARAAVPIEVGSTSSVTLAGVTIGISSVRDANGIAVCVNLRRESEKTGGTEVMDDWRYSRIGVKGGESPGANGARLQGGGDVVVERNGTVANRMGVVRFDGAAVNRWNEENPNCREMWLSVEVELFRGRAAMFVRNDKKGSDSTTTLSKKKPQRKPSSDTTNSDKVEDAPTLNSTDGRQGSGATEASATISTDKKKERARNGTIVWTDEL